jgi:hypothetical protein
LLGRGIVIHAYYRIKTCVPAEDVGESLKRVFMDAYIGVDEYKVLAAYNRCTVIARARRAAGPVYSDVLEAVPRNYRLQRLGRPVIDNQHVKIFTV